MAKPIKMLHPDWKKRDDGGVYYADTEVDAMNAGLRGYIRAEDVEDPVAADPDSDSAEDAPQDSTGGGESKPAPAKSTRSTGGSGRGAGNNSSDGGNASTST